MFGLERIATAVRSLDLSSRLAVVCGGTQGIGAAVATQFARCGANVILLGRNEGNGTSMVQRLKEVNPKASFEYLKSDLSLVKEMESSAAEIKDVSAKWGHKVDYLVQTQGTPPKSTLEATAEGIDQQFAVQILSRFAIPYLLHQNKSLNNASVVNVCSPGGSFKQFDISDIELKGLYHQSGSFSSWTAVAKRIDILVDTITAASNDNRLAPVRTYHIFPGLVFNTGALSSLPAPLPRLISIFSPIISSTIGRTPESYAPLPVFVAAHPDARNYAKFLGSTLNPVKPTPWSTSKHHQDELWGRLSSYLLHAPR